MISGIGLVTPLGRSAWSTFRALLASKTIADGAADSAMGGSAWAESGGDAAVNLVRAAGSVRGIQRRGSDPAIDLAEIAAREALLMAGTPPEGMPCILGASKGAVVAAINAQAHILKGFNGKITGGHAVAAISLGPHGYLAHHLRTRLGLGAVKPVVAACASGLVALHLARLRPAPGGPRHILVVSSEASLLPAFIHSYRRLGVLPELTPDGYRGRPLDRRRRGFMLAEQAAAVVLERIDEAMASAATGKPAHMDAVPVGTSGAAPGSGSVDTDTLTRSRARQAFSLELLDTAIAAEAFDLLRPAPGMPALAYVAERLLAPLFVTGDGALVRGLDLLHPHATGTIDNDQAELAVYAALLGCLRSPDSASAWPDVYACKGALGHSLGAAGLAALVLACLCARTGRRPPMPWLHEPIASPLPLRADSSGATGRAAGSADDRPVPAQPGAPSTGLPVPKRPGRPVAPNAKPSTHAIFAAGFGGHVAGAVIAGIR